MFRNELPTLPLRSLSVTVEPRQAARLAAGLFALVAVIVLGTMRLLPAPVAGGRLVLVAAVCVATAFCLPLVPWSRLPPGGTLAPYLWAQLCLGGLLGAYAGQLSAYLLFYVAAALYAGTTQTPRACLLLAPCTLGSPLLAVAGRQERGDLVDLLGAAVLSVVVALVLSHGLQRSGQASRAAHALLQAVSSLHGAGTEDAAADVLADLADDLLTPDAVIVLLAAHPGSSQYLERARRGLDRDTGTVVVDTGDLSGVALALSEARALFVPDAGRSPLVRECAIGRLRLSSLLFVPVPGEEGFLGCLVIGWRNRRSTVDPFGEQVVAVLSTQAGALLERLGSVGRLQVQATTDPLTGLANRRSFLEALDRLRPGGAVVFLDLDHFKRLNDTQGHAAGDEVLRLFGAALRASVREGDCAARYGGEEFALVLPSAASVDMTHAAGVVVDRLRDRWDGPVTFSAGIASHQPGDAPSATLARADAALYAAKARGRNTLVVAEPTLSPV